MKRSIWPLLIQVLIVTGLLPVAAEPVLPNETASLLCDAEDIGQRAFDHISAVSISGLLDDRAERDKIIRYFGNNALVMCREGSETLYKRLNGGFSNTRTRVEYKLTGKMRPDGAIGLEILTDGFVAGVSMWRDDNAEWFVNAAPSKNQGRGIPHGIDLCPSLIRKMTHTERIVVSRAIEALINDRRSTDAPKPDVSDPRVIRCYGHCGDLRVAIHSRKGKRYINRQTRNSDQWMSPWANPLSQIHSIATGFTSEADAMGCATN